MVGTKGVSNCQGLHHDPKTAGDGEFRGQRIPNPYRQEHDRPDRQHPGRQPHQRSAKAVAESTMTGIMGREAVYSGRAIHWDTAMQSTNRLGPNSTSSAPIPSPRWLCPGGIDSRKPSAFSV